MESLLSKDSVTRVKYFKGFTSTACYRGYLATWCISNDSLFLIPLHKVFGSKSIDHRVFADWVSDSLVTFKHPFKMENNFVDETEYVLTNGRLDRYRTYTSVPSKYDKDINLLSHYIYSRIKWEIIPNLGTSDVKIRAKIVTTTPGKVDSVIIRDKVLPEIYNEIRSVILSLDDWTIQYRERFLVQFWSITIVLNESTRNKYKRKSCP